MLKHSGAINEHADDTSHVVQLFDSDDSRADGVARFLHEGIALGEQMLAVISAERWYAVAMRLSALGRPVDDEVRWGRLIVRDARQTMNKFMRDGRIHRGLFFATVGTVVSGLADFRKPVRIYGEMVDLLVEQGEYGVALELERLWNELAERHHFKLLCGYTSGHFGDPRNADDLRRICGAHRAVHSHPEDLLGPFLVGRHNAA